MEYIELNINITPTTIGNDLIITYLSNLNYNSYQEHENGICAYITKEEFNEDDVKNTFDNYFKEFNISYSINIIEQQNWNNVWESNFNPIIVENKCIVRAPFHETIPNIPFDIVIEPKMSFGTGHHQTTQLMLKKILDIDFNLKSVLDVGCGTGVLAILAHKKNAKQITAIDIDEWSYLNSLENFKKNNLTDAQVILGDINYFNNQNTSFDILFANINKNVLLNNLPYYSKLANKNGIILLSGFFDSDINELELEACKNNFTVTEKNTLETWAQLTLIKN